MSGPATPLGHPCTVALRTYEARVEDDGIVIIAATVPTESAK
jgi:hypothetical protein